MLTPIRSWLFSCTAIVLSTFSPVLSPLAKAEPADVTDPAIVESFVDGAVKGTMETHHSPSGVVAVMKNGEVILLKGYGFQDVEKRVPVTAEQTMFRPGSISKLFTWVSVMQLVEQGLLDLDVDVNNYLETFEVAETWPGQPVTLRHIMTHTAGFEDGALGYLIVDDFDRIMPLADALASYQPERVFPPGKRVAYSNWATALAGLIVSNVSEQPFNDYVQEHIFEPLAMTHSSFDEPLAPELQPYMAKAYRYDAGKYTETPYEVISNFGPAGAAAVSAPDMIQFATALLSDGAVGDARILQPETLQRMLDEGFVHDERVRGVGLGFLKRAFGPEGLDIFGHDGATSRFFSHLGLSRSEDFMLFSSFSGPEGGAVNRQFVAAFYDEFFPAPATDLKAPDDFSERAERYAGVYNSSRGNFSTIESILRSLGGIKVAPMSDNTLMVGEKRYIEIGPRLFQALYDDTRIAFQETTDGSIDGFVMDGFGVFQMYRVPFYEAADFTLFVIGLLILVALLTLLRIAYQWRHIKVAGGAERRVELVSLAFAVFTLAFYSFAGLAVSGGFDSFYYSTIPWQLKFALLFPLLLVPVVLVHIYQTWLVWSQSLFFGLRHRLRHSFVSFVGLLSLWFYYYWNLLGFNYMN